MPRQPSLLAYLCTWTRTNWKCGCRDSACTQSYWQIQSWEAIEAEANGEPLSSLSKPVEAHYVFNGNTVFINKPIGPLELHDFQKGEI
jgi:hypothetical protein